MMQADARPIVADPQQGPGLALACAQPLCRIQELSTGLHRGIDHEIYHQRVLGMASNGALELVARSPLQYRTWVDAQDGEDTKALAFGRGFHCALVEPECFARTYAVAPDFGDCRANAATGTTKEQGKANKERRDAWRAEHPGVELVSAEDWQAMLGMAEAIRRHPFGGRMLVDGEPELTARWTDKETGISCKCRGDYYVAKHAMIVDIKTTLDARADAFVRSVVKYGYHHQDAFYRAGFAAAGAPVRHFAFIAVEKAPPYDLMVHTLDESAVATGYRQVRRNLATLAECMKTNTWPGYPTSIQTLSLPRWAA